MFNNKNGPGWNACYRIQEKVPSNPLKTSYSGQRPNLLNYYGDGSGRDSYVIFNYDGGNGKEYRRGYVDYQKEWLRNNTIYPYETPQMNKRLQDPMMVSAMYTKTLSR